MRKKLRLSIPESLSEITLDQYQKFVDVISVESNVGTHFLKQKTIEIFCNVPLKFVDTMAYKTAENVFNHISNVLMGIDDLQNAYREQYITAGGIEFGFIPNFEDISMGELVDMDSRMGNYKEYHEVLAVLYRPVTMKLKDKYLIEEYDGLKNDGLMKSLPLDKALKAIFFLLSGMKTLELSTQDYLREEIQANPVWKQTLAESGAGTTLSLPLLSTMYLTLMLLPIRTLERC